MGVLSWWIGTCLCLLLFDRYKWRYTHTHTLPCCVRRLFLFKYREKISKAFCGSPINCRLVSRANSPQGMGCCSAYIGSSAQCMHGGLWHDNDTWYLRVAISPRLPLLSDTCSKHVQLLTFYTPTRSNILQLTQITCSYEQTDEYVNYFSCMLCVRRSW